MCSLPKRQEAPILNQTIREMKPQELSQSKCSNYHTIAVSLQDPDLEATLNR